MPRPAPRSLDADALRHVVRSAPLVSIDLIVRDPAGRVLLGLRSNEPARGWYFVPGGMIRKNESLAEAFARILTGETGLAGDFAAARLLGAYEHFYDTNRFAEPGYGTHYIALGYELRLAAPQAALADAQHSELRWWTVADLLAAPEVHANVKAYFG